MKLQSMTDYVLEQQNDYWNGIEFEYGNTCINNIISYAKFLKLNLEKWMFIPCDSDGNVLEEPKTPHTFASENSDLYINKWQKECEQYQQAKDNVIFEGFEFNFKTKDIVSIIKEDYQIWLYKNGYVTINAKEIKTIEDLVNYDLTLTDNAIKKYKL